MADSQTVKRQAAGLFTQYSPISAPPGALLIADNAVIDREGVISNRRGFNRYHASALGAAPGGLWEYRKKLVILDGTTLKYDTAGNGSSLDAWTGTFSPPASDVRVHALEVDRSFFFTTSYGVLKADAPPSSTPLPAGIPQALDVELALAATSPTWFSATKFVSYRVVWTRKDANGVLVVGSPSSQYWIEGDPALTKSVTVTTTAPLWVKTGDILEVYRTDQADTAADLGDRHFLAGSVVHTGATTLTFVDTTDEIDLGLELYASPFVETISQANHPPPWCKHMSLYKGHVFYGNIKRPQQVEVRLDDRDALVADTSQIILHVGSTTNTYTGAAAEDIATHKFQIFTGDPVEALDIRRTALSLERVINRDSTNSTWYAQYISGLEDLPGRLVITAISALTAAFTVDGEGASTRGCFEKTLPATSQAIVDSTSKVARSKFQQAEAVPEFNTMEIGRPGYAILGMAALKGACLIWKEDGIYSISGETDGAGGFAFVVDEVDPTILLVAPDSLVTLDNAVYGMTTQGVIRAYEGGSAIVSRPIEKDLKALTHITNFATLTHAVGYESEHKYILFTPEAEGDTYCKLAWVYDYLTNTWTRWRKNASAGIVLSTDQRLYLGHAVDKFILRERKDYLPVDYQDEAIPVTVTAKSGATVTVSYSYTGDTIAAGFTFAYSTLSSKVTAVSSLGAGSYLLTLADTLSLPTVSFTAAVILPIHFNVQWTPEDAGNVGVSKQFSYTQAYNEGTTAITSLAMGFHADTQGSEEVIQNISASSGASVIRAAVPLEHQRCRALKTRLQHDQAGEKIDILQLSHDVRIYGSKTYGVTT